MEFKFFKHQFKKEIILFRKLYHQSKTKNLCIVEGDGLCQFILAVLKLAQDVTDNMYTYIQT